MRTLPRRRGAIAVLFLVWAVWLAFPYFGLGPDSYVRIHDNADSTLPASVSLRTANPSHLKTAWNPLPVAGVDQVPVSTAADVHVWLFSVLPGWLAYGLVMFAQRFIAGYFTFRLLKDRLGLGFLASLCAGLVYASFAQTAINSSWAGFTLYDGLALACLPLVLWALDDEAGWSFGRRLVIAVGLGFLLGFTSQYFIAVFVVLAVAFWLLVRRQRSARQTILVMTLFVLTWAVAEAPAIWGSLLNAAQSHRADWALRTVSLRAAISRQYSYVSGILLDNQVMVAAALLGLAATRLRNRALIAALGASAAIFLVVLASGFWLTGVRRYAGPLAGFQVDRFYLLAPFALIVSGALGLDALAAKLRGRSPSDGGRRGRLWAVSLTLLVLLVLGPLASVQVQARIVREMRAGSTYAALYERPELRRLAAAERRCVAVSRGHRLRSAGLRSADGMLRGRRCSVSCRPIAWAYGLETVDGYVVMYSARYQRFWGCVTERALADDQSMSDKYWDWGSRVYLFIPQPGAGATARVCLPAVTDIDAICNTNLLSLANVRYLISPVRIVETGSRWSPATGRQALAAVHLRERTRHAAVLRRRLDPDLSRIWLALLAALGDASLEELGSDGVRRGPHAADVHLEQSARPAGEVDWTRTRPTTYRCRSRLPTAACSCAR